MTTEGKARILADQGNCSNIACDIGSPGRECPLRALCSSGIVADKVSPALEWLDKNASGELQAAKIAEFHGVTPAGQEADERRAVLLENALKLIEVDGACGTVIKCKNCVCSHDFTKRLCPLYPNQKGERLRMAREFIEKNAGTLAPPLVDLRFLMGKWADEGTAIGIIRATRARMRSKLIRGE